MLLIMRTILKSMAVSKSQAKFLARINTLHKGKILDADLIILCSNPVGG